MRRANVASAAKAAFRLRDWMDGLKPVPFKARRDGVKAVAFKARRNGLKQLEFVARMDGLKPVPFKAGLVAGLLMCAAAKEGGR